MTEKKEIAVSASDEAQARRMSYNRLVREARLLSLDLRDLRFRAVSPFPPKKDRKAVYDRKLTEFVYLKSENAIVCSVEWIVEIRHKRKTIAKCVASYKIFYDSFTEVDEEIARLYAENVAFAATYSYFRALYANLDWSAGLMSSPLPIVKFTPRV